MIFKPRVRRNFMASQSLHSGAVCVPFSEGAVAGADQGRCIGLVDARFMGWLVDPSTPVSQGGALQPTAQLVKQLHAALCAAGLDVDCVRLYWYSDQEPSMPIDGVVFRCVPALDSDAGLSAVRAMSADMVQLAHNKAVDNLLLVSDDERLWSAVDTAQLQGLRVHALCDTAVLDFARLQQDDPSWARLLNQVDRRVVWHQGGGKLAAISTEGTLPARMHAETSADAASILAHIERWWSDEPASHREELRDELRQSRSIPQELDRQLLLRLSRELGRPLSWPDKKVMREGLRRTIMAEASASPVLEEH